eukprot:Opistho-1_new@107239
MLLVVPLQYFLALLVMRARRKNIKITDVRVQIMHEILNAIKLVKFYAWERSFAQQVKALRKKERHYLQKIANYKSIHLMIVFIIPPALVVSGCRAAFRSAVLFVRRPWRMCFLHLAFITGGSSLRFPISVVHSVPPCTLR